MKTSGRTQNRNYKNLKRIIHFGCIIYNIEKIEKKAQFLKNEIRGTRNQAWGHTSYTTKYEKVNYYYS